MKSNSLLTYLLYALLGALILSAGYKACQMQKEKKLKAKEEAEWQETLKKLYPEGDSTGGGSAYINRDSAAQANGSKTAPTSGVEGSSANSGSGAGSAATKPSATTAAPTAGTSAKPASKGSGAVQGVGSGKWEVRAGAFKNMEGARTRLEEVIRIGYTNAEIKERSDGIAIVIVLRTNDQNKAKEAVNQLSRRGVDAALSATGK